MKPARQFVPSMCLLGGMVVSLMGCKSEIPRETGTPSSTSPTAAAKTPLKRVIILVNNPSSFWDACRAGVLDANRELNLEASGLVASMEVPDGTIQGQLDRLRQFATQTDIAAIGISPLESDNAALADEVQKLKARGIPVVTFDSDLNRDRYRDLRMAFLGTNNFAAGEALGQCAKSLQPDGGGYVTFVGKTGAQNAIERIGGFAAGAGDKFMSLDKMADDGDRSRAKENVRNALRNHQELKTLVGIWSYNAPAIVDVVREQNARSKVAVVVFDAEPLTIEAMQAGEIDALVVQDPYATGYQSVRFLSSIVKKDESVSKEMFPQLGQPDGDLFDIGIKVVVPNKESRIQPGDFSGNVQYLTLDDFKAWLKKYNLTGS